MEIMIDLLGFLWLLDLSPHLLITAQHTTLYSLFDWTLRCRPYLRREEHFCNEASNQPQIIVIALSLTAFTLALAPKTFVCAIQLFPFKCGAEGEVAGNGNHAKGFQLLQPPFLILFSKQKIILLLISLVVRAPNRPIRQQADLVQQVLVVQSLI